MADTVEEWLEADSSARYNEFVSRAKHELIAYHNTVGRRIRNHFKLWSNEWLPEYRGGVDHSPDHPDAVSMRVIHEVWERKQHKET